MEPACLEAEHRPAGVAQREDEPLLEVVVSVLAGEAGGADLLGREALLAGAAREAAAADREPEAELAAHRLAEPAPGQIVAGEGAGRRVPEVALVEDGGVLEQREEPLAAVAPGVVGGRRVLVLGDDPGAPGQPFDRADEVERLRVADEADHVAALVAAVAVVELVDRVHREARCPLLVERAAADEPRAGLPQRRALLDDRNEVHALAHGLDGAVLDPRHG